MTLQQLHYILTIAETGSMNKAAELLYVSQPNLTSAVKEPEQEFDFAVFHRSGRGVTPTREGTELLSYARQVWTQMEALNDRFFAAGGRRRHFGVSTQHYSFTVQAFARMVRSYDTASYDFSIRETRTQAVIEDVASLTSEIGILYLSDFNRAILTKMFEAKAVEFHPLTQCQAYVYLSRNHPLATLPGISFQQLKDYPCLSFEQGGNDSFYFAEEILTTMDSGKTYDILSAEAVSHFADTLYRLDENAEAIPNLASELPEINGDGLGSTDCGNISQVAPTIQPTICICREKVPGHSEAFKAAACSQEGLDSVSRGASALALTALRLLQEPDTLRIIQEEHAHIVSEQ